MSRVWVGGLPLVEESASHKTSRQIFDLGFNVLSNIDICPSLLTSLGTTDIITMLSYKSPVLGSLVTLITY